MINIELNKVKVNNVNQNDHLKYDPPPISLSLFFFFDFFRAAPTANGGSEARSGTRAVAAGLHHSHCNIGSEPRLRPTPQLTAMLDLLIH